MQRGDAIALRQIKTEKQSKEGADGREPEAADSPSELAADTNAEYENIEQRRNALLRAWRAATDVDKNWFLARPDVQQLFANNLSRAA